MSKVRKMMAGIALASALALGLWLGLLGSASANQHAQSTKSLKTHATKTVLRSHGSKHQTAAVSSSAQSTSGGTEDQSDSADSSSESDQSDSSSEATSTNETDTHEDPKGQDVNHECPPNCDTANGEQP